MPVWHERTKDLVAAGRLKVLGITQEQHPARCRLFAQWHGIDWPILWDPFNLTGSKAVPRFTLIDARGVVRKRGARPRDLEAFLDAPFEAPADAPSAGLPVTRTARPISAPGLEAGSEEARALHALLTTGPDEAALGTLAARADAEDESRAARRFRYGVALRMRHDTTAARPDDFARALEEWSAALRLRPDQYIWRRRIQQYGPRPDKPYPFYDWVERARTDVAARGETPIRLPVPLTMTERSVWRLPTAPDREPDPRGLVPSDDGEALVRIDAAVAWSTTGDRPAARVHLRAVLVEPRRASFDAGQSVTGWGRTPSGSGWEVAHPHLAADIAPGRGDAGSTEPVPVEVEVGASAAVGDSALEGYLLVPLCLREDGRCVLLRRAFRVPLRAPGPR